MGEILMEYTINVKIVKEVEVNLERNDFCKCREIDEKIEYIKEQTKKQYGDIDEVNIDEDDLNELQEDIDDMNDTSDMLPNESYEEYMEHEDF